jgi:hypothetical protein
MKKFIISLIVVVILPIYGYSQTIIQTFTDPCTKLVSVFNIPITGSTTVIFYNKHRTFTAADVNSGVFQTWVNQVYEEYRKLSPCSVAQTAATATQVTASAVSTAVSAAASSAASSASSSAASAAASSASSSAASSSGGGSSESSSSSSSESSSSESSSGESKSESKSESKGGGGKSSSKSGGKAQARVNPILFNSDFTGGQSLDRSINVIATGGISQSSMAGDMSWGVTGMVWSNLKQFALSGRYTKMNFDGGKLQSLNNYGVTVAYAFGSMFGFATYAYIYPMGKWGVTGANLTVSVNNSEYAEGKKQYNITHSLLLFYTKPFPINRRITISPDLYISGSPVTYATKQKEFLVSEDMGFLTGASVDYSITKRFKINLGIRTSLSTNPDQPALFFAVVGSKVNL